MSTRTAAQTLFNRIIATWITPEVESRAAQNLLELPLTLVRVFLVWKNFKEPEIFLNEELSGIGMQVSLFANEVVEGNQTVLSQMITGLESAKLPDKLRNCPYILILRGHDAKYYVLSQKMHQIVSASEFKILHNPLATEGFELNEGNKPIPLFIDSTPALYGQLSSPAKKRELTIELTNSMAGILKQTVRDRVKRSLRLPYLLAHLDDEFLPLLIESRQTYIDGHFFSCIASSATTADRICNRLTQYYGQRELQKWILDRTLGEKPQKLRSEGLITKQQEELLMRLNTIRIKHLHPRQKISDLTTKRDALKILVLLHQLLEGTFGLYKEHTIVQGRIVPKPLA